MKHLPTNSAKTQYSNVKSCFHMDLPSSLGMCQNGAAMSGIKQRKIESILPPAIIFKSAHDSMTKVNVQNTNKNWLIIDHGCYCTPNDNGLSKWNP